MRRYRSGMTLTEYAQQRAETFYDNICKDFEILERKVGQTFSFIVTALAATLAFSINLLNSPGNGTENMPLLCGTLALLAWMFGIGAWLILSAMRAGNWYGRGNLPSAIMREEYKGGELDAVRVVSFPYLEKAILKNNARTAEMGKVLNRARACLVASPILFFAAWGIAALLKHCAC